MKSYRPYTPEQSYLLPPSPRDWLPPGHLVYFVAEFIQRLDLGPIERRLQAKDGRGERPYSPALMTSVLLYAYATGVFSSRRIERATVEDVAFRFLVGNEHPHFTTINLFRNTYRQELAELFIQVLRACQKAGLVKLGHVAIDGSKMKANASKHKAMSHDRMTKDEARLRAEVESLLNHAEQTDAEEDALYGKYDEQEEIRRREEQIAKMQAVREALERETKAARAKQLQQQAEELRAKAAAPTSSPKKQGEFTTRAKNHEAKAAQLSFEATDRADSDERRDDAQAALSLEPADSASSNRGDDAQAALSLEPADSASSDRRDDAPAPLSLEPADSAASSDHRDDDDDLPRNTPPSKCDGTPEPKAQRNFTDPQSRIMKSGDGFEQAYNVQIAVDEEHQIIVAAALSNQGPDAEYFIPMLDRIVRNCDAVPERVTADSGYFSSANVRAAEHMGCEPFISVGKHRNDGKQVTPSLPINLLSADREAMRAVLETPAGHAAYARRKATVEPVFGQIKHARGLRQLLHRGLRKNRLDWLLVCATHNLLKLFRARPSAAT